MTTAYQNWDIAEIIADCLTNPEPVKKYEGIEFVKYSQIKHGLIFEVPLAAQHLFIAECILFQEYNRLVELRDQADPKSPEYLCIDVLADLKFGYLETVVDLKNSILNLVLISHNIRGEEQEATVMLDEYTFTHYISTQYYLQDAKTSLPFEDEEEIPILQTRPTKSLH